MLNQDVSPTASSHLFLNVLTPFSASAEDVIKSYEEIMPALISKYATRLLNLRVDEIEVRATAVEGDGQQAVRLMASSMSGQWLKADGYLEYVDPKTGETASYCTVADKDSDQVCYIEPYAASTTLSNKRSIARRIGTTYAYDFIGLIEKALVSQWQTAIADGAATEMPLSLLAVDELLDEGGDELVRGSRIVGENTVGMVGSHLYPSPRP